MAKRSLGMVLTEYSEKKEGKDSIETIMSLIEFPLLDQTSSNSVISTTPNDLSNW
jgi:NAD(P)H-quinone oxidoreductase subunit K